jgi:hypothetical protein
MRDVDEEEMVHLAGLPLPACEPSFGSGFDYDDRDGYWFG